MKRHGKSSPFLRWSRDFDRLRRPQQRRWPLYLALALVVAGGLFLWLGLEVL